MNDTIARLLAQTELNAQLLTELVWEAAHRACARLTHGLPEAVAHELADRKLEETLSILAGDAHQQIRFLIKTLGEAEAARRVELALADRQGIAA